MKYPDGNTFPFCQRPERAAKPGQNGMTTVLDKNLSVSELDNVLGTSADLIDLIFEAPLKRQQAGLILRLGNRVNLGHIPPPEAIALETLRLGLRGDTVRHFHLALPTVPLE